MINTEATKTYRQNSTCSIMGTMYYKILLFAIITVIAVDKNLTTCEDGEKNSYSNATFHSEKGTLDNSKLASVTGTKETINARISPSFEPQVPSAVSTRRRPSTSNTRPVPYFLDVNQTKGFLAKDVSDYACSESGFCNKTVSKHPINCNFHCSKCRCDEMCHVYGDCCPDLLFPDSPHIASSPNPYISCSTDKWTTWGGHYNIFMVSSCPDNSVGSSVFQKCGRPDINDRVQATPVSDITSGLTYKNKFCAHCHNITTFEPWVHNVTCDFGSRIQHARSKVELWRIVINDHRFCDIRSKPPSGVRPRKCYKTEVDRCNVSGTLTGKVEPTVERLCEMYQHPVYYFRSERLYTLYRNVFCAVCNGADIDKQIGCYKIRETSIPSPLSILLDFNPKDTKLATVQVTSRKCPDGEVFEPISGSCRRIRCPARQILEGKDCELLSPTVIGLGFSVSVIYRTETENISIPRNVGSWYNRRLSEKLRGVQPYAVKTYKTDYYASRPSSDDEMAASTISAPTDVMSVHWEVVSKSQWTSIPEMETLLMKIMAENLTYVRLGWNITLFPTALFCPDPVESTIPKSYRRMPGSRTWTNSLGSLDRYCRKHDCSSLVLFEHIQPNCSFGELNISEVNLTVKAGYHTIYFAGRPFEIDPERIVICNDVVKLCTDVLQELSSYAFNTYIRTPKPGPPNMAMSILSLVCISLSLAGLVMTFLVYSAVPKLRTLPGKNIMALVFHLFWAQFIFLLSSDHTSDVVTCQVLGALLHYFWLSSYGWMSISAYHVHSVFTSLCRKPEDKSRDTYTVVIYVLICMAVPLCITTGSVIFHLIRSGGVDSGYGGEVCFLNSPMAIGIFFAAPLCLVLLLNIMFFVKTILAIQSVPDMTLSSNQSSRLHAIVYMKLSLLFGFTWLFGIMAAVLQADVLWYVFVVLTGSHGVLLFVAFCVNRRTWALLRNRFGR